MDGLSIMRHRLGPILCAQERKQGECHLASFTSFLQVGAAGWPSCTPIETITRLGWAKTITTTTRSWEPPRSSQGTTIKSRRRRRRRSRDRFRHVGRGRSSAISGSLVPIDKPAFNRLSITTFSSARRTRFLPPSISRPATVFLP
jgi:hypothetical protein